MQSSLVFLGWLGAIGSLLLSVIAFFLKLLIQDFRQLKNQLQVLRESVIRIEQEQSWIKALLESSRKKIGLAQLNFGYPTHSRP